jgi:hypothetical protein
MTETKISSEAAAPHEAMFDLANIMGVVEGQDGYANAIAMPESLLPAFDDIAQQWLEGTTLTDQERITATTAVDYKRWQLFGLFGATLPPTLVVAHGWTFDERFKLLEGEPLTEYFVCPHPGLKVSLSSFDEAVDALDGVLDADLTFGNDAVVDRADSEQANEAAEAIMRGSRSYATINALIQPIPNTNVQDRPLRPHEVAIREAQLAQDIIKNYGLQSVKDIATHPNASAEFRTKAWRIEEETILEKAREEMSVDEKILEFTVDKLISLLEKPGRHSHNLQLAKNLKKDTKIKGAFTVGEVAPLCLQTSHGGVIKTSLLSLALSAVEDSKAAEAGNGKNSEQQGFPDTYLPNHEAILVETFLRNHFLHRRAGVAPLDPSESLQSALQEATARLAQSRINHPCSSDRSVDRWLVALRVPRAEIVDERALSGLVSTSRSNGELSGLVSSIVSRERIETLRETEIGEVVAGDIGSLSGRIISTEVRDSLLPQVADAFDVHMRLEEDEQTQPFIPGYHLIAGNGLDWYFVATESDPYKGSNAVMLPQDKLSELSAIYRAMGMEPLAGSITRSDLTLGDLVGSLADNSEYSYDSTNQGTQITVKDGKAHVQCTGAALLLNDSIDVLFPGFARAQPMIGNVIRGKKITAVEHMQIRLSLDGAQYILDATPSGSSASSDTGIVMSWFRRLRTGLRVERADAPQKAPGAANLVPPVEEKIKERLDSESLAPPFDESPVVRQVPEVDDVIRSVEDIVGALYGVTTNDKELYEKVVYQLSKDDPLYRALRMLAHIKSKKLDVTEVGATADYIEHVADAKLEQLRQRAIPRYQSDVLRNVAAELRRLVS